MMSRRLNKSMEELFPQEESDACRVCNDPVVDGRWNYCSEWCRDIAQDVQDKFLWGKKKEFVLSRDDHTCQQCGLSKEMQRTAYWQTMDLFEDREDRWKLLPEFTGVFHVDHITPISEGGHKFNPDNLQTLCKWCHAEKTSRENTNENNLSSVVERVNNVR